jgi:hypothetical protein
MQRICTWYAPYMQIYAEDMQWICTKNAPKMHKICKNMHLICTWYAIKYARNMQEYARICIGAYFAYFASVCTPHFADGSSCTKDCTEKYCFNVVVEIVLKYCSQLIATPDNGFDSASTLDLQICT